MVSDAPRLVYLRSISHDADLIVIPDLVNSKGRSMNRAKRRFSFKSREEERANKAAQMRRSKVISGPTNFTHLAHMGPTESIGMIQDSKAERKSRIISAPLNFSHVAHMGPSQGMQVLIDLPQAGKSEAVNQRVKSMFQPKYSSLSSVDAAAAQQQLQQQQQQQQQRPSSVNAQFNGSAGMRRETSGGSVSSTKSDSSSVSSIDQSVPGHPLPSPIFEDSTEMSSSPQLSIASNNSSNRSSPPGSNRASFIEDLGQSET